MADRKSVNKVKVLLVVIVVIVTIVLLLLYLTLSLNEDQTMSSEDPLAFLGDDYKYGKFPYSNFTLNNFKFAYWEDECKNNSIDIINILPCGSRLIVNFPSYSGWQEISTQVQKDSIKIEKDFRWVHTGVSVVNGVEEWAGLLLIIGKDGSRIVYATTQQQFDNTSMIIWIVSLSVLILVVYLLITIVKHSSLRETRMRG